MLTLVAGCASYPSQVQKLAQATSGSLVTDLGWKDTVLVLPGETERIAIEFTNAFPGDQEYMFHCHNQGHENSGMLVNCRVTAADSPAA